MAIVLLPRRLAYWVKKKYEQKNGVIAGEGHSYVKYIKWGKLYGEKIFPWGNKYCRYFVIGLFQEINIRKECDVGANVDVIYFSNGQILTFDIKDILENVVLKMPLFG